MIRAKFCVPFVLQALRTFAGPAPDTQPNIEGKTDDPEGVPCAERFPTGIPLVFRWYRRAATMCRDGQQRDDRDDLFSKKDTNTPHQ
jgi:hypothetical protein